MAARSTSPVMLPGNNTSRIQSVALGFALIAPLLLSVLGLAAIFWYSLALDEAKRTWLIQEADHEAILETSRDLMNLGYDDLLYADDPSLPSELSSLNPSYVLISDSEVRIEFGGGFHHQGLCAFKDPDSGHGSQELLSGLWFYEDTE